MPGGSVGREREKHLFLLENCKTHFISADSLTNQKKSVPVDHIPIKASTHHLTTKYGSQNSAATLTEVFICCKTMAHIEVFHIHYLSKVLEHHAFFSVFLKIIQFIVSLDIKMKA